MAKQVETISAELLERFADRGLAECEVFEHGNWNTGEDDEDGLRFRTSLRVLFVGDDLNDKISSLIVYSGRWRFYQHANFQGASIEFGVGQHNLPGEWNDKISSYEPV